MGMIGCVILGAVAGTVARAFRPQPQPGGLTGTIVVGIVGAIVGATIASALGAGDIRTFFNLGTWSIALAVTTGFLAAYTAIVGHDVDNGREPHGVRG
jgi:uncharacterized membrane protein YeaQ/YmgE (transglycosylase-associated protein family)